MSHFLCGQEPDQAVAPVGGSAAPQKLALGPVDSSSEQSNTNMSGMSRSRKGHLQHVTGGNVLGHAHIPTDLPDPDGIQNCLANSRFCWMIEFPFRTELDVSDWRGVSKRQKEFVFLPVSQQPDQIQLEFLR